MLRVRDLLREGLDVPSVNEAGEREERATSEQAGGEADEGWGEVRTAQQMQGNHGSGIHEFGRLQCVLRQ